MPRTKASSSGLGKTLIKRRVKEGHAPRETQLYSLDDSNPLQSVTHERDLDEFLANAALADADFTTERSRARIVAGPSTVTKNPYLLSAEEEREVIQKQVDLARDLRVPRRPPWTRKTTRLELEKQERESFLDWRRGLARLAESSELLMTPFERNLQLWRQLWRVLERSHLIVQIVDARNPLGFRCVDLERYVLEIGDEGGEEVTVSGKGKRRSLLLINKADLLTLEQRSAWADWFEKNDVTYAFFSAANAAAAQEQAERQRQRANGIYDEDPGKSDESTGEVDQAGDNGADLDSIADEGGTSPGEEEETGTSDLAHALADTTLAGDEEEGWSTEGEDDADLPSTEPIQRRLDNGETVPLKEVAWATGQENQVMDGKHEEGIRTRVLSVTELEELFISSAPDIEDFATDRQPHPGKLMVGLVGYPNVGKSSTINALLGAKKVSVSSTPGKTKHFQTLVLSDEITLCDCPGLVFPQFANTQADMIVDGILPIDQMKEYSAPVDLLCQRITREILEGTYGIRIDVKPVEDGGSGQVVGEELLSTYAIARGMTRASFGMPDTSRAARYILKDYVNARLTYAHPPPGMTAEDFMQSSREQSLRELERAFENGRKRAPATHVSKNADTFVAPAPSSDILLDSESPADRAQPSKHRQLTSRSVRANAASAPMKSGREKSDAVDNVYFSEAGPAPRPVAMGRNLPMDPQEGGFSRPMMYAHQRLLGADGMPIVDGAGGGAGGMGGKRHFKRKEGKKRSGRGYD